MTTPLRATLLVPESVADVAGLRREVNRILILLQGGGVLLGGLKLDTQRGVPTAAPQPGSPNVVFATNLGVVEGYAWNGSAWVQFF